VKKGLLFILVFLFAAFINLYPDQSSRAQSRQPSGSVNSTINITGKITKESDGYYIQGKTPPEIYRILNPTPRQLDKIIKTGKMVKIEVQIVLGDNVNIERINGKPYSELKRNQ